MKTRVAERLTILNSRNAWNSWENARPPHKHQILAVVLLNCEKSAAKHCIGKAMLLWISLQYLVQGCSKYDFPQKGSRLRLSKIIIVNQ